MRTSAAISAQTVVSRSGHVAFHVLAEGEGGVLLHLDTGAYHGINDIGVAVWEILDEPRPFAEIVARLEAQLEDVPTAIADDVRDFLTDLSERDLVSLSEPRNSH
jgi:hypothetical protein